MNCDDVNAKLADLLLEPEAVPAGVEEHLSACGDCRRELDELRGTLTLLDEWKAPEPNPYFMTRLTARLEEERQAAPVSWWERVRMRFQYGSRVTLKPVAVMSMMAVLLVGGGAYLEFANLDQPPTPPAQAAVVHDLQTMDNNAQLLDVLDAMDQGDDSGNL